MKISSKLVGVACIQITKKEALPAPHVTDNIKNVNS